jgi:hypothetical protein
MAATGETARRRSGSRSGQGRSVAVHVLFETAAFQRQGNFPDLDDFRATRAIIRHAPDA